MHYASMKQQHPDEPAILRVGEAAIMAHFGVTKRSIQNWRKKGVPRPLRMAMASLGAQNGKEMPEMFQENNSPRKPYPKRVK